MLCTDFMPRSHDAALQEREGRFYGVSVNVAHDVDAVLVANRPMPPHTDTPHGIGVSDVLVRDNHVHVLADVLAEVLGKRGRPRIRSVKESEFAISLADANDNFLVLSASAPSLPSDLDADTGFIHLNCSSQLTCGSLNHRRSNSVAQKPSRTVSGLQHSLHLESRHSLFGFAEKVHRQKPLVQRQMSIMEDGAREYAKLVAA
jgi:hypothetical protein